MTIETAIQVQILAVVLTSCVSGPGFYCEPVNGNGLQDTQRAEVLPGDISLTSYGRAAKADGMPATRKPAGTVFQRPVTP